MNKERGAMIVISGPSGVGKGTIVGKYMARDDVDAFLSVSWTTRQPRTGDINGIHYWFKTREEFEDSIKCGGFLEYARVVDNYYGTPKAPAEEALAQGRDVIFEIDVEGAKRLRDAGCRTIQIFIEPPSMEELESRLRDRGTETEEQVTKRLANARREMDRRHEYEHRIVNQSGDVDGAVDELARVIKDAKAALV